MKTTTSNNICLLALALVSPLLLLPPFAAVSAQVAPLCETLIPYSYDSGPVTVNRSTTVQTTTTISHPRAPWMQLDLSQTRLATNARLVVTSDMGVTQILDGDALTYESHGYSAVLGANNLIVTLIHAKPKTTRRSMCCHLVGATYCASLCRTC